ncbi:DEAD/DEAH box helicase [Treponema denticola]|uniref:DEAD/DEAH box helicase n=1 Tax=Treponema denticola TaxID=158 RepID=UPI003D8C8F7F
MDLFTAYQQINDLYEEGNKENEARQKLIQVLDEHEKNQIPYNPIINHLIRKSGLYPYIKLDTALWEDRIVYEAFKVDIGKKEPASLHIEQSRILKLLLKGQSIAISAPTSFGKSFIIDSFIAVKHPDTVVLIVPTIALMDETRRRLQNKFSDRYKIITNTDITIASKNIFIFPQERAVNYIDKINSIDLLIIDEFYKASISFDEERAPALIRAIIKLSKQSKQKYFLAPNISHINQNPFTDGMECIYLDYNTVFLKVLDLHKQINETNTKEKLLLEILEKNNGKTLIYAGTYNDIDKIVTAVIGTDISKQNNLLINFAKWLCKNYSNDWVLPKLIEIGFGIHNGQLHRALAQIQIYLFGLENGLQRIISTSSIIEGVNTSAENVIIWRNKNGRNYLNDFTYKNIIGRSGRMFRHFIGNIFLLDRPPTTVQTELNLELPTALINDIDIEYKSEYVKKEQITQFNKFETDMISMLGEEKYEKLKKEHTLNTIDTNIILKIVTEIYNAPNDWKHIKCLNSDNVSIWDNALYKIIQLLPGTWDTKHANIVKFIKILSKNWIKPLSILLEEIKKIPLDISDFFKLERNVAFKLTSLLQDINTLYQLLTDDATIDISPFIAKTSHAFLPKIVYQLEEYGLPRMISKQINNAKLIDLENNEQEINDVIQTFLELGIEQIKTIHTLDEFDKYILQYFYDGIKINKE